MTALTGLGVFVLEDEALIAMLIEDMLGDLGCVVIGPAFNPAHARTLLASEETIQAAIIDVNLGGVSSREIAGLLAAKDIPFAFVTGHGVDGLPEGYRDRPVVHKPIADGELENVLLNLMRRKGGGD